jgi:hypothetical protein
LKRLRRILLNTAAAISLLLCLAAAGDWTHSHWRWWSIDRCAPEETWEVLSDIGALYFSRERKPERGTSYFAVGGFTSESTIERTFYRTARNRLKPFRILQNGWAIDVIIPHWVFVTLLAIPPLLRFRAWRRHRRRATAGTCVKCGYDLRVTPDRCRGCGSVAT